MQKSVIIHKKAGHVPPRGFIQAALAACPTCYGIAIQDKGDDGEVLDVIASAQSMSLDKLMDTLEACKDQNMIFTLGDSPEKDFNKDEDLMPFVFEQASSGDDDPPEKVLAVFVEGDLPNYCKVGEGHTEAFHFWEDFLFPTISEKFDAAADLPSFYDKLKTSAFQQSVLNPFSNRGVAIFVPLVGDVIAYGKNELGAEFPWGSTSNVFNWKGGETFGEKAKAVVGKAKSRLAQLTGSTPSPDTPKVDDKGIHHLPPKVDAPKTDTAVKVPSGTVAVKPPQKLQGNARNAWIRLFTGAFEGPMPVGHNHKDYVVHVPTNLVEFAQQDVSSKDDVKRLTSKVKAAQNGGVSNDKMAEAVAEAAKVNEGKDTIQDPAKNPASKPADDKRPASDFLPDMSAEAKKGSVDLVTDWATRPADKQPTALQIQKIESKWPIFSTVMGIKPEDMLNWTIADIKELMKKYPDAGALAFVEMKHRAISSGAFKLEVPAGKTEPQKVEVPAAPAPAVAPVAPTGKKSRLASLTGAAA